MEPSYVLRAVGADDDLAHSSIRFGIGRFTTEEEVDYTVERCVASVNQLREMRSVVNNLAFQPHLLLVYLYSSPLYEMVKEGIDIKSIQWSQH